MVSSKIDMVETGRSYMRELVATFDQATVSFATFMDKQVLVLRREYPRNCVTRIDLSQQLPAYCTGLGKALLSTKSEEEIDEYIATVPRTAYTLHTLTDGARLNDELKSSGCNVIDVPDKAPWQEACAKVISENTSDQAELYQQLLDMKA